MRSHDGIKEPSLCVVLLTSIENIYNSLLLYLSYLLYIAPCPVIK